MTRPLWTDPTLQSFPTLGQDLSVDVAIVGAGFSGLGAAWALLGAKKSVAVLEARSVASCASGRNAGFVLAGPAAGYSSAVERFGPEEVANIWDLTRENARLLARIIETYELDVGYLRRGSMCLAASREEWDEMVIDQQRMEEAGISCCLADAADLPRPFDRMYQGGVYFSGNAEINPGEFLRVIARLLAPRIQIFESTEVTGLDGDGTWMLRTAGGSVHAECVIVCTNAWTATLLPGMPIAPTRGQVLATEPLPRVVVPFPMYANRGFEYWRQTAEGRLVAGGWRNLDIPGEVGHDEAIHPDIQEALERFTREVAGPAARIEYRWAGIMGFTPDMVPLVGPVPHQPGLFMAAGYSGHGVAMAFLCGHRMAQLACGMDVNLPASFAPRHFSA